MKRVHRSTESTAGGEAKIAICINNSAQQIGAQLKSTYLVFRDSGTGIFLISDSLTGRGGELSNLGFKYQLQAVLPAWFALNKNRFEVQNGPQGANLTVGVNSNGGSRTFKESFIEYTEC